jgi:hypothetical protein
VKHGEWFVVEVAVEVISVNRPDHAAGDVQEVDELGLQGKGINVVVANPVFTVV